MSESFVTSLHCARIVMAVAFTIVLASAPPLPAQTPGSITVGSKAFTESVILGDVLAHLARNDRYDVQHRRQLGGTQVLFKALERGDIDAYPEYTGTITQEIFAGEDIDTVNKIRAELAKRGIAMSRPLGFNNTYALGMREDTAATLGIAKASDLIQHPDLRLGFGNEFMDRGDGWKSLQRHYQFPHQNVVGLDHDLAYRGLNSGDIDVMDVYSTDAKINLYKLRVLDDDLRHFPEYQSVVLYRQDLGARFAALLATVEGQIDEPAMQQMNARAESGTTERQVAADFLINQLEVDLAAENLNIREPTTVEKVSRRVAEHLKLVGVSLSLAILVAIPLGIWAAKQPRIGQVILAIVGIIQTIPSLALFVFFIPLMGIGAYPAVTALFLYSLLPIVRNTCTGIQSIPPALRESAEALGLSASARLRLVELPIAAPAILAGIKTSAVINVGTATVAALIGANGLGQPIITGIRLDDTSLILQGAIPAALLALAVQGVFELAERFLVPKGLRLASR